MAVTVSVDGRRAHGVDGDFAIVISGDDQDLTWDVSGSMTRGDIRSVAMSAVGFLAETGASMGIPRAVIGLDILLAAKRLVEEEGFDVDI